ncbi:MAG: hypothetical protein IJ206_01840 [Oscillospiraceae bacterium]|nr:hypothetical protein [Oscillospiraceae bacterium]
MTIWSILRKLILIPIIIVLTLIEWCGAFLTGIANAIITIIAVLLILVAGLSAIMGLASGMECLRIAGIALGCIIAGNMLVLCASMVIVVRDYLIEHL